MTRRGKDRRRREVTVPSDRRGSGPDRRVHTRVTVDIEVDYKSADNFLFAYITDISAMGIFIRTNAPEAPGTKLNLSFAPQGGPRRLHALARQSAGRGQVAAEAGEDLLVEHGPDRPPLQPVEDEADRV